MRRAIARIWGCRRRVELRRLGPADFASLFALRLRALELAPSAFFTTLAEEKARGEEQFRKTLADETGETAIFGAVDGSEVVGMTGVYRGAREKERHKAHIWGVFVAPERRGGGLAGKLLDLAVARAKSWDGVVAAYLCVESSGDAARRLYESRGFKRWGTEPLAFGVKGKYFDEDHMVLALR